MDLGREFVDVVGAGTAGRDHVAADRVVCLFEAQHRRGGLLDPLGAVVEADDMTLVPHHAAHREAAGAGAVGERARRFRCTAAARHADVHVDQDLADPIVGGRVDRLGGVDRDRDPRAALGHRAQPLRVDGLVREQQVVTEARPRRGRRSRVVSRP